MPTDDRRSSRTEYRHQRCAAGLLGESCNGGVTLGECIDPSQCSQSHPDRFRAEIVASVRAILPRHTSGHETGQITMCLRCGELGTFGHRGQRCRTAFRAECRQYPKTDSD